MRIRFHGPAAAVVVLALAAALHADVLHLKDGKKIEGKILKEHAGAVEIETRFGVQTIDRARIQRIERGLTAAEEMAERHAALAPDDAAGRWTLAEECEAKGLKELRDRLREEILAIDPDHEETNRALGRVRHGDRWVTPAERDALVAAERDEEMRAKGLVLHEGRYVTPEEKRNLEAGLVLKDGQWIPEEEAKLAEGFVRGADGGWVRIADQAVDEAKAAAAAAVGHPVGVFTTEHVAVYTDVEGPFAETLAKLLEKGWGRFAAEFQVGDSLDWFGPRRADFFVFKLRRDYDKFLDHVGREKGLSSAWVEHAHKVDGIYLFETWGMATTFVGNRGDAMAAAHCCNMLGHVLLNSYRCEGRQLPPLLDEAFAALTELELTGRNAFFSVGFGRYGRELTEDELQFFEDGRWVEPLRDAIRELADTPLDQAMRRDHASLSQMDVAKGMALYLWWRSLDPAALRKFFDALRDGWPAGNPPPTTGPAIDAVRRAFIAVFKKPLEACDPELRAYVMKTMKD